MTNLNVRFVRALLVFSVLPFVLSACGGADDDASGMSGISSGNLAQNKSVGTQDDSQKWIGSTLNEKELAAAEQKAKQTVADQRQGTTLKDAFMSGDIAAQVVATKVAYRFYNSQTGAHFYTTSEAERDNVIAQLSPPFQLEGPAFAVASSSSLGLSPVHRFYNLDTGVHFYTISEQEKNQVLATLPQYNYEGIGYYASMVSGSGFSPLYRFYLPRQGHHFYTASADERDSIITNLGAIYQYEGIGYYALSGETQQATWSNDSTFNPGVGANNSISSVAMQPDGKSVIGGTFGSFGGQARFGVARVNADGSSDAIYNGNGTGTNGFVWRVAMQPDGKALVGGDFTLVNNQPRARIARLNADGSLDTAFNPGTGFDAAVVAVATQPDGKILVGGSFTSFNSQARNRIARLHADGTLDTTFTPGTGFDAAVVAVATQPDGKILVGGDFTSLNGQARNRIARLNVDGTLDATFAPGTGADGKVTSFHTQADGKIVVGGWFTTFNGQPRGRLARLNADGSLDASFNSGGTGFDAFVTAIKGQSNGQLVVAGNFGSYNNVARVKLARMDANGVLDTGFVLSSGFNNIVTDISIVSPDKMLVVGYFTLIDGAVRNRIARINQQTAQTTAMAQQLFENLGKKPPTDASIPPYYRIKNPPTDVSIPPFLRNSH